MTQTLNPSLEKNPVAAPPPFWTLSRRIIIAMVAVGFFSAIIATVFYQGRVTSLIRNLDERNKQAVTSTLEERLRNSKLPPRVREQVEEILELRQANTPRPGVEFALDQAIGAAVFVAIVASFTALALGWLLTRRIVHPLEKLRVASRKVAAGDFTQRVAIKGEDEIGQVAYSFNLMARELENAENRRRALLSDIAHELKTPLASIQGHIEALRDLPKARANPDMIVETVLEDVAELNRMISSLRGWLDGQSMVENLDIKPLNLNEEVPAIVARFTPRAEKANITLDMLLDGRIAQPLADRNALRHMLSNLLDNALRYTPDNGHVQVLAWPGEGERPNQGDTSKVTLVVTDTGCGIAPEHWPHLFKRFYRVDKSRTRDSGGTGLGLSLVHDLVIAQKGRIWLSSQLGRGTTFFITLPAIK